MGLLTAAEQKQFPLETEIATEEEAREDNEVANKEDNIALALPSANVDKSEEAVEKCPKKSRKLQRVTTLELIDQRVELRISRPISTKMRSANVRARSKMKIRRLRIEEEDNTECSEIASQCEISLKEWAETSRNQRQMVFSEEPSSMPAEDPHEEGEEQGDDTTVETLSQDRRPLGQPSVYTPSGK